MCMFCRSLFVLLSFFFGHCVVCSSLVYSDYPIGIFKLFLLQIRVVRTKFDMYFFMTLQYCCNVVIPPQYCCNVEITPQYCCNVVIPPQYCCNVVIPPQYCCIVVITPQYWCIHVPMMILYVYTVVVVVVHDDFIFLHCGSSSCT
jgi:hypothetical protein